MTPMVDENGIHVTAEVIVPIMLFAMAIVIVVAILRGALVATLDELVDMWRTFGPVAIRRALDHRPGLAATPWFCAVCRSYNGVATKRCYSCEARREDAEADVPADAEAPAGPSAGRDQRTRRTG